MSQSQSLNVIALISGGKDSFFSILHCLANNHRIVALANLHPPPLSTSAPSEDLDSYMYQTVGHTLIPLYATALALPLYRQEISGSAVDTRRDYGQPQIPSTGTQHTAQTASVGYCRQADDDETESLIPLLQRVLVEHPSATAVCSGAILSTYQRTRIESVALRLNLVPLSYLWQYPTLPTPFPQKAGLLEDMRAVGLDARIVKVASGGLDDGLLWGNVLNEGVRRRVERAVSRFGGSALGEGGEYETLVLDGPKGWWKGRVEVKEGMRWTEKGKAGEAWVSIREGGGRVVMKAGDEKEGWRERLKSVDLWDEGFRKLAVDLAFEEVGVTQADQGSSALIRQEADWQSSTILLTSKSTLKLLNMTATSSGDTAEEQMTSINAELIKILRDNTSSPDDIVFTTCLLGSMTDFSAVNSVYARLFTKPNPPARVTVACGDRLPRGVKVMLSFIVALGAPERRDGLHVQSRSYWAPANIGPYSQAISVPLEEKGDTAASLVYIAGQIPLVPATMELFGKAELSQEGGAEDTLAVFREQTCLSLQHLWRIGKVMHVGWWTGAIAFITGRTHLKRKAIIAWLAWKQAHERARSEKEEDSAGDDDFDAWDKKYGGKGNFVAEETEEQRLPDLRRISIENDENSTTKAIPGFFAVEVEALPRGSEIEWQSLGLANATITLKESSPTPNTHLQTCAVKTQRRTRKFSYLSIPFSDRDLSIHLSEIILDNLPPKPVDYSGGEPPESFLTIYTSRPCLVGNLDAQIVPCRAVWGAGGRELVAGVVVVVGV